MGPAQVHLAETWQWYVTKDNDTQGEQVLKPLLTLPPSLQTKNSGQWPDLESSSTQGSQKSCFSLIYPGLLIKTVFAVWSFYSGYMWVHYNLPPSAYSCKLTSHYCLAINCMCL